MSKSSVSYIILVGGALLIAAAIATVIVILVVKDDSSTETTGINYNEVLREYCQAPDSTYSYQILPEYTSRDINSTTFILNMTSQKWSSPELVGNGHIWWHYMSVTVPDVIEYEDTALLFITSGSNNDSPPDPSTKYQIQWTAQWAVDLGMVTATLFQIPNQPITFPNDKRNFVDRYEDDIIAFTWRRFILEAPDDPYFLLRMPMTKAAVRAMDTISTVANPAIDRFYITGVSKRGWTTWSAAAVDKRVVGIAPQVLDLLNMKELTVPGVADVWHDHVIAQLNLQHHYQSLDGWTFALEPYWSENVTRLMDHPNLPLLQQVSDPFFYRDILTMPKYVITAGNDEFFLPDDAHYFYDQMKGPTYLRIHPDVGHNLLPRSNFIRSEMVAFVLSAEENWKFPDLSWTRTENATHGEISLIVEGQVPRKVKAYRANSRSGSGTRDFRLHYLSPTWNPVPSLVVYEEFPVDSKTDQKFVAVTEKPDTGWTCFFIEVEFAAARGTTIRFTTEVNIIPDEFTAEPCSGEECYGSIV